MKQTENFSLKLFEGADNFDYEVINENFRKVDEQLKNKSGSGGLTAAQISALDGLFKIAAYTADASDAYAAFKAAFADNGGGEVEPDNPDEPDEPVEPDNPDEPNEPDTTADGYLYHFNNSLASSGTKSLGLTAPSPVYSTDAKFGSAIHINNTTGSHDSTVRAIGIPESNIPVLDGDFTIAFWGKLVTGTTGYLMFANKFESADVCPYRFEITQGSVQTNSNTVSMKYCGVSIFVDQGKPRVRIFNKALTKGLNAVVGTAMITAGTWNHYALCRKNGVVMFFVNGVKIFSVTTAEELYFPDQIAFGTGWVETGTDTASQLNTTLLNNVMIDEFLIDDTYCYYSDNFTPNDAPYGN